MSSIIKLLFKKKTQTTVSLLISVALWEGRREISRGRRQHAFQCRLYFHLFAGNEFPRAGCHSSVIASLWLL